MAFSWTSLLLAAVAVALPLARAGATVMPIVLHDAPARIGARCLDGTGPVYYYRYGAERRKFQVFFQGGGVCASYEQCVQRSRTPLGSSINDTKPVEINNDYLSVDSAVNPLMHNWTVIVVRYCDGAAYSGNNDTSYHHHDGTTLYFRGIRNIAAIIDDLHKNRGLSTATDVVVSGCSAGGIATYLHIDYIAERIRSGIRGGNGDSVRIAAMPDSGFFRAWQSDERGKPKFIDMNKWIYDAVNATLNTACVAAMGKQSWKCIFAETVSKFIATPTFALQSKYDSWQIKNELGDNGDDVAAIREYGAALLDEMKNSLLLETTTKNAAAVTACARHCGVWQQRVDDTRIADVFAKWYSTHGDGDATVVSPALYKCTPCCDKNDYVESDDERQWRELLWTPY